MAEAKVNRLFEHLVTDADECVDVESPFEFYDPPPESISMVLGEEGFWLSATREGFLHLARVFAEMALRDLEPGYHFHVGSDFGSAAGPEFSFELVDGPLASAGTTSA